MSTATLRASPLPSWALQSSSGRCRPAVSDSRAERRSHCELMCEARRLARAHYVSQLCLPQELIRSPSNLDRACASCIYAGRLLWLPAWQPHRTATAQAADLVGKLPQAVPTSTAHSLPHRHAWHAQSAQQVAQGHLAQHVSLNALQGLLQGQGQGQGKGRGRGGRGERSCRYGWDCQSQWVRQNSWRSLLEMSWLFACHAITPRRLSRS